MRHQPDNVYLFPHSRPCHKPRPTAIPVTADHTVAAMPPPYALPQPRINRSDQHHHHHHDFMHSPHRWDEVRRPINFKRHQHPRLQRCGPGSYLSPVRLHIHLTHRPAHGRARAYSLPRIEGSDSNQAASHRLYYFYSCLSPSPLKRRQVQRFLNMVNFHHWLLANCPDLMLLLTNVPFGPKGPLELNDEGLSAFERIKASWVDVTLLTYPAPEALLSLIVDVSTVAMGAVLQQHLTGSTCPLVFFFKKLSPAEMHYSTFGHELLGIYPVVKYFRPFLESSDFTIFTDHKPPTFDLRSRSDRDPRRLQADRGRRRKTHGRNNQAAWVGPRTMVVWNVRSLLDNPRSNQSERRTALVARELARYKVDIAVLNEACFSKQGQPEDLGAGYTFFCSSRPRAERRGAGVGFAIRNDIAGRLPCLP
ncbi:hypothetical protein SprV_0100193500 [Sparganum proliferum]